jgi:hypothetical protein
LHFTSNHFTSSELCGISKADSFMNWLILFTGLSMLTGRVMVARSLVFQRLLKKFKGIWLIRTKHSYHHWQKTNFLNCAAFSSPFPSPSPSPSPFPPMVEIELRAYCMLGKHYTMEPHPQPFLFSVRASLSFPNCPQTWDPPASPE